MMYALNQAAGQRRDFAVELKLREKRGELRRGEAGARGENIPFARIFTQGVKNAADTRIGRHGLRAAWRLWWCVPSQLFEDVLRAFDKLCALFDESVTTLCEW